MERFGTVSTTLLFLVVTIACILPVLLVQTPPLHDYPFHIARMDILARWHSIPALQSYYDIGTFLLPNVGMDVIVLELSQFMPVETAGRVFVALTIFMQISGCMVLYRSLYGRYSPWPLASAVFVYNWIFLFAFLNYLFGLGLVLWASALWIALAWRSAATRIVIGTLLATALFFCHLIACGLFGVIVAGFALQRAYDQRYHDNRLNRGAALGELLTSGLIFVLPALLFLASPTAEGSHLTSHKLVNLLWTPLLFIRALLSGNWVIDALLLVLVPLALVILWRCAQPFIARSMRLALILLVVTFIFMPHQLFGGWGADTRIALLIVWVAIASTELDFKWPHWARLGFVAMLGFVLLRGALFSHDWIAYDRVYAGFRQAFRLLPPNAVLFTASEYRQPSLQDVDLRLWQPPLAHVASLASLENPTIFVATTWATKGQQPITPTPTYEPLYAEQNNTPVVIQTTADLTAASAHFSTLCRGAGVTAPAFLLLTYPERYNVTLPANTRLVAEGERFQLLALTARD